MLIAISVLLLGIGLCMCGWHLWRIFRRIFLLEVAVGTPSASHNTARDEIAAAITDLVAYLDGDAPVRPGDEWHKRLRQLSSVA
jgi:hypothetical protein